MTYRNEELTGSAYQTRFRPLYVQREVAGVAMSFAFPSLLHLVAVFIQKSRKFFKTGCTGFGRSFINE
jgi:hypothetical protein